ncbi:hypothetical protein QN277_001322 [Acacia crassicarpa]|uniref:F-box domain-containing protein n=1 Tax=Acacia crassicarpa TaxID=499986 RepID=A0AAE1N8D3_9FABA|nr:hypothetical protein QN277_001322 [Acacia crassicarpa]
MMEVEAGCSLSNLPDEVLQHIFSFLNIRNIARLRVLSRRFHTLCTTSPSLFFCERPLNPRLCNCSCPHVFNFMNTLPQHRPHAFKINLLCFSSYCKIDEHRSLHDEWINKLFQTFQVDELYLYYHLPSIFKSLSRFHSLKVLKLKMRGLIWVKLPVMKLASLETLYMQHVETEDSVGEWVSQSFPSLKSLFLSYIKVAMNSTKELELTIRSSCLEVLSMDQCCAFKVVRITTENLRALTYGICFPGHCHHHYDMAKKDDEIFVEISAPNLQSLFWKGAPTRLCYDERTFKNLHVATITHLRFQNLNLLIQLFEAVRWARLLHIDTDMLKDIYGKPSISFGNVRHFEICVYQCFYYYNPCPKEEDYDNVGDVLFTFLKRLSNLETLTFVSDPFHDSKAEAKEYIFKGAVKMCEKRTKWKEIRGVKKLKFKLRSIYHSMILLIGMLKTHCVELEEMTLIYPSCYHELIAFYLNCLESASSALSINCVSV